MKVTYFAQVGEYVKIGYTTNLRQRMSRLRAAGDCAAKPGDFDPTPPVRVLRVIEETRVRDEHRLHDLFAEWRDAGEWFRASPEFLAAVEALEFETDAQLRERLRRERREAKKAAA